MKKIEKSELEQITKTNSELAEIKEIIANIEIQKHQALHNLSALQVEFKNLEDELIKKYGDNILIDIRTGKITKKEDKE
jgi:putative IMPACT (imprinted ancient) family translation regulator